MHLYIEWFLKSTNIQRYFSHIFIVFNLTVKHYCILIVGEQQNAFTYAAIQATGKFPTKDLVKMHFNTTPRRKYSLGTWR